MSKIYPSFRPLIVDAGKSFTSLKANTINPKNWQGLSIGIPMREVFSNYFRVMMPYNREDLASQCSPDLPWADLHFEERVSMIPTNPGETYCLWPYYKEDVYRSNQGKFTHTYQERFWPKMAGENVMIEWKGDSFNSSLKTMFVSDIPKDHTHPPMLGIRYPYGDLMDVVKLLSEDPLTRQAYLPIWFPEDTGVSHRGRVPCSLGYLFSYRDGFLHLSYDLRSCDYIRHFNNDLYMAGRLVLWMLERLREQENSPVDWTKVKPGILDLHITSFHVFESDMYELNKRLKKLDL